MSRLSKKVLTLTVMAIIILCISITLKVYFDRQGKMVSNQFTDDLIFISNVNSQGDIFRWNSNSKSITNLTHNKKNYLSMVWSPDGKKVAFTLSEDSQWKSYMMNIDGTGVEMIQGTTSLDLVWGWSPDSSCFLLQSYRDVNQEIYCLEIDSGKAINLTNNPGEDYMPVWSPDGKSIAFISNRDKQGWDSLPQLYIMDLGAGDVRKINTDNKAAGYPVWSPDSKKIAIALKNSSSSTSVYIVDIDSSRLDKVEAENGKVYPQVWSADGERVLVDQVTTKNDLQNHNTTWVNLKDNTIEQLEHDIVSESSYYRTPSYIGKNIVIKAFDNNPVEFSKEKLALVNGTLIDGTGSAPFYDAVILLEDGLIQHVGNRTNVQIPDGYKLIDLTGSYVLPGFINTHVHYGYDSYNLKEWARQGVTTVRDMGADIKRPLFDMRNNINNHPQYSRLVMAGPLITVPGGYPSGSWAMQVTSPEDAKEKTLLLIEKGVDVIKVALETGEPFGLNLPILSSQELKAIVDTAHSSGKRVTAHVSVLNSKNIEMAVKAGIDDFAHNWMTPVDDSIFKNAIEKSIFLVPTNEVLDYSRFISQDNLKRFIDLGGNVALGTDYGGDPYGKEMELGMPLGEIRLMMDTGMTPMQVFTASTQNAAVVCGMEKSLGTIEKGKIGDLLILYNNPLERIENLKNVHMVIKDGCIIFESKP